MNVNLNVQIDLNLFGFVFIYVQSLHELYIYIEESNVSHNFVKYKAREYTGIYV